MLIPLLNGAYHNPLEHWIRIRTCQHNQNFMGVLVGMTGSGKSWSAISLGEGCDPKFKIDNVTTSAKEMVDFLVSKHHNKGTAVVIDEAGVNFSNRKWMTKENKALGELFQTFRWMNIALFFTLPNFTFLDSQQRKLTHFIFEQPHIDRDHQLCFMKGKYIIHDDFSEKFKGVFPLIRYPDGRLAKVNRFAIRMASEDLLKQYELKKKNWNLEHMDKIKKTIVDGIDVDFEKKIKKVKNDDDWILKYELDSKMLKVANEVQKDIDSYVSYKGKLKGYQFNTSNIRADFLVNGVECTRIVRYLMRKPEIVDYLKHMTDKRKAEESLSGFGRY